LGRHTDYHGQKDHHHHVDELHLWKGTARKRRRRKELTCLKGEWGQRLDRGGEGGGGGVMG